MDFRIYIVDASDINQYDTSFQEIKESAKETIFGTNLEEMFKSYISSHNDDSFDTNNTIHFLVDEAEGIVLAH